MSAFWEKLKTKPGVRKFLESGPGRLAVQFFQYGIVGVANTAINYGVKQLCNYVLLKDAGFGGMRNLLAEMHIAVSAGDMRIIAGNVLGFIASTANSFYWNSRYTFRSEEKRSAGRKVWMLVKTALCYALTGVILAPLMEVWLAEDLSVPYWLASILTLVVTVPMNFALNKLWAYRDKPKKSA